MEPVDASWPAWATEEVHVADPDPRWAEHAEQFAGEASRLLNGWLSSCVAHVGSTAVPGLAAKPVIDLQVLTVDPAATIAATQEALAGAWWHFVPRELDQRPWRWLIVRADASGRHRLAHLHLMRPGEPRWRQQLAFRDKLRAAPGLAQEYARVKAEAAHVHVQDREAYTQAKHSCIRRVLDRHA